MQPPCRVDKQKNLPTSVLWIRTQVHALGGFNMLELPLVLVLGRRLGLSWARGFPETIYNTK